MPGARGGGATKHRGGSAVAAYLIAEIEVTDPVAFAEYLRAAGPIVARYGGRLLAAGPGASPLEGGWEPKGATVIEFPSPEAARRWYDAPEYQAPKRLRLRATTCRSILVDGLPAPAAP